MRDLHGMDSSARARDALRIPSLFLFMTLESPRRFAKLAQLEHAKRHVWQVGLPPMC